MKEISPRIGLSALALAVAGCTTKIEITPPGYEDLETYRARIGLCGLSGDTRGAISWFQLVDIEKAPPLGEVRKEGGGEQLGYTIVEQSIGNSFTGEFTVPEVKECERIGFRDGQVWIYRGLIPIDHLSSQK